jgi:hypothetical protein
MPNLIEIHPLVSEKKKADRRIRQDLRYYATFSKEDMTRDSKLSPFTLLQETIPSFWSLSQYETFQLWNQATFIGVMFINVTVCCDKRYSTWDRMCICIIIAS